MDCLAERTSGGNAGHALSQLAWKQVLASLFLLLAAHCLAGKCLRLSTGMACKLTHASLGLNIADIVIALV
jgi:hypothetical protein